MVIRLPAYYKAGLIPSAVYASLPEKAPNFVKWSEAVTAHPSVNSIYDEDKLLARFKARFAAAAAST
jgi:glutathione S-transferase